MNESDETKLFVAQLFGLEDQDIETISYFKDGNDGVVEVRLTDNHPCCKHCKHEHLVIKEYRSKKITHSALTDRKLTLWYHARRYYCKKCHTTFYEPNPFVFKNMKISIKTVFNILDDLKNPNETFKSVGDRYHVSPTSVASIFDSHVSIPRKQLPERINIDEVYAFKSQDINSRYVCVILDNETHKPIDILPSKRLDYLLNYFREIPIEERKNVQLVCSDMYEGFRTMSRSTLPNSMHVVDRFHMRQDLNKRLNAVRIRIMNHYKYNRQSDEYYLLKKFSWMVLKNEETDEEIRKKLETDQTPLFDPNRKKHMNRHFKRFLNYYEIREMIWKIDPALKEICDFRDEYVDFYESSTYETAPERLNELIRKFRNSNIREMREYADCLSKWRTEIINSFLVVGREYRVDKSTGQVAAQDKHLNNAILERINSTIKIVKKTSYGYKNWTRFRNRVMYVLDEDASYFLNPIEPEKKEDE